MSGTNGKNAFDNASSMSGMQRLTFDLILRAAAPKAEEGDYRGEDGLLYCGKCRTPKEAHFGATTPLVFQQATHRAECTCAREKRQRREAEEAEAKHLAVVAELKRRGFINAEMKKQCFANDNGHTPQMSYARKYVDEWEKMRQENVGYLLWGSCDSGKSYLAACIANALMEKEVGVCMTNFPTIHNDLIGRAEGRRAYIDRLCAYPLLILDDLGSERGTEYGLEQVYSIIDSRYRSQKPLIVTTNLTPDDLLLPQDTAHARIYSRILDMCVPILCTGAQNRTHAAQKKMALLTSMMTERE